MSILEFIAFVLIFGGAMYFAWHDGFEQGRSAANRMHVRWWGNTRGQLRRHGETLAGLDNRIDGIEARLAKLEDPNTTVVYADGKPYTTVPDIKPEDTPSPRYKFRCEPELDDICKSCTRQGTSICYGCGFDHVFYDKNTEKPEDWSCDTCVNDGDMSHLQCRYCDDGSCYIRKEVTDADTDSN